MVKKTVGRKTKCPRISVLMGVYNAESHLAQAIESILSQSYRDFEFLIIDDASADGSRAIIERYAKRDKRIRLIINRENLGLATSLNVLMREARGEYFARMDADDVALPRRFSLEIDFLERHPGIGVVGTWADIIDAGGKTIGDIRYVTDDVAIRRNYVERSQLIHPTVMFRAAVFREMGGYDPAFRSAEDYEYFPRVMTRFAAANIPQKLLLYRWVPGQNEGFVHSRRQERSALCARWWMITRYGWPWWQVVYLLRPIFILLLPLAVKRQILRLRIRYGGRQRTGNPPSS